VARSNLRSQSTIFLSRQMIPVSYGGLDRHALIHLVHSGAERGPDLQRSSILIFNRADDCAPLYQGMIAPCFVPSIFAAWLTRRNQK
jgi:hypothetical protein